MSASARREREPRAPARASALALTALSLLTACEHQSAIRACTDDLHGVWRTPSGERWGLLDHGATLEAFALFDDAVPGGAPRAIDVSRADNLAGSVTRRYTLGATHCEARAPIRITACTADELQLVVAEPQAPLAFSPCTFSALAPSRVERWRRE